MTFKVEGEKSPRFADGGALGDLGQGVEEQVEEEGGNQLEKLQQEGD